MSFDSTSHKRTASQPSALDTAEPPPDGTEGEVESPSISTPQARARFEFEPNKSNEGTKVVMVEWEDDDVTKNLEGTWTISWEGKSTVLPAEERNVEDERAEIQTHRTFFLLPAGVSVPALITLTLNPADKTKEPVVWRTNPLPAIFPPGFAESAVGSKKPSKGVLHTLWAKKRLHALQKEIEKEEALFPEGIALAMAVQEKEWIEETFGLGSQEISSHRQALRGLGEVPQSPSSPLSPGGSRLSEKLKGLKLQTKSGDYQERGNANNPLSPEEADIAIPSFSAFKGANPAELAAKPAQRPSAPAAVRPIVPQVPSRQSTTGSVGSLAGIMAGTDTSFTTAPASQADEDEDELFAMPLSPRSPEMTTSPFSFATSDTLKYVKGDQVQRVA
ncbi:uncharacterized protein PV09_07172 [Verruconis gallopava]|uniref:Uncharacterized protein n=1 Tax=Verruconis gallopava TaxID=253628 RepID=A0A0D2A3K6_9PEZI|nr:uncharacterized protein PV09_07172 [Verruconis gallopava]KIW01408.1 hypothetical protein PV09_07172 [Verruconis gallopava]